MMYSKEVLAKRVYDESGANEVLKFLEKVAPEKTEFRNEKTFLNFVARKLQPMLRRKAREDKENQSFWINRAISMDIGYQRNKNKNVLWCIRLLSESL